VNAATLTDRLMNVGKLGLGVPLLIVALLAMVVVPLPPILLDAFFTFNITLSLIIMLAVIYVQRPLDFAVFPTVLLGVTLLRLALNVASTRVVLLHGHTGPGAAGHVIEAFGNFVVGGNYAVGIVVFVILVVINFVVVTKGAGRVSEVSARFTLDAMPGKQMAIDADLNAGLITQQQAIDRRAEVVQEADFYGAMDGASKFVRGDAVAGILVLAINIVGGLVIGTLDHGLSIADAGRVYTLLTIGDGLVAQIPALLASTAVAVIVTRMSRAATLSEQVVKQLLQHPRTLTIAGGVVGVLGLLPGMPNAAFLTLAAVTIGAGYWFEKRAKGSARPAAEAKPAEPVVVPPLQADKELGWDDVSPVDLIGLEVGYRLIPLVDRNQSGPLLGRIKAVRRKLSEELGFLIQAVHIRDNLELKPNAYRIAVLGVPVGEGEIHGERDLAINPGGVTAQIVGIKTKDPAFGLDAYWIEPAGKEHALSLGFTVVDSSTVVATHLSELLKRHAHQLLGHEEVQQLLDRLAKSAPKLVENLTPGALTLGVVVKVMQDLLVDRVPVRNIRTIAETLAENAARSQDPTVLLAHVREALGSSIVQGIYGLRDELPVITLDPTLEQMLRDGLKSGAEAGPSFEPGLADRLHGALADAAQQQEMRSDPAVLLVPTVLRPWLARFTRHGLPNLAVLAYGEIPNNKSLRVVASVGSAAGVNPRAAARAA
jgi:flagellar biosynthesis protein FlhA